jgi:hypothetical protein
MRACTTANAILLGVVVAAATFAACASSGTQTPPPGDPNATDPNADPAAASAATEGSPTGASDTTEAPPPPPKKQPETVADCKELKSDITNEPPPSAVPMNNATAPGDAGVSTRLQPMVDIMRANRDKFRCCFDLWGRKNPGASGRVMLRVKLKPDGAIMTSEIVEKDTTVAAPEVHACVVEVARSLTYPASPTGKETTYTHPFDFKARH